MDYIFPIYLIIGIAATFVWFAMDVRRRDAKAYILARTFSVMLGWPVYVVVAASRR